MKITDKIKEVWNSPESVKARVFGSITDQLRVAGMNYNSVLIFINKHKPADAATMEMPEFDGLLMASEFPDESPDEDPIA